MKLKKEKVSKLVMVIFINLILFGITNILFDIKYEQVDDFIIYHLYSGLDGTYNPHGIYIHPLICFIISLLFRIVPMINWHSIFLLSMQFICFTVIGYTILKKHNNGISVILYTIFAGVFYTALLMLIQYTSVAALLILTSFIVLIDKLEKKEQIKTKEKVLLFVLYTLGIMTRMQSLLIIVPFMIIYFILFVIGYNRKKLEKTQLIKMLQYYFVYLIITTIVYLSNSMLYQTDSVYKEYIEYNEIRTTLQDLIYVDYEENKEIFDEVGWSQNDHYMYYTFNFGDENIYSKENLEKILDAKIQKDGKNYFSTNLSKIKKSFLSQCMNENTYITIVFTAIFITSLFQERKAKYSLLIFVTTVAINVLFIVMNRSMLRVVIPEYILGTALIMYHLKIKDNHEIKDNIKNCTIIVFMITWLCMLVGNHYNYDYQLEDYESCQKVINYTNHHKENVYLYTVPSLQFRYLAYSVYQMPPKSAFSNLRVMGGWDMFTQNYYDFKKRYNLEGNLLDLLKDYVYLVDGDVYWSGRRYQNYKSNIVLAIKENYDIDVKCEPIEQFDNLAIYKVNPINKNEK